MSLKVWLPLTGTLDNFGTANVSVTNNGATIDNSGKIGKCYYFNGSSHIRISLPTDMTTILGCTVAAWVKSESSILALGGISQDVSNWSLPCVTLYTSGWQFTSTARSGYGYVSGGTVANTNVWHHVACTVDASGNIQTYLDGAKVASSSLTTLNVAANTTLTSNNFIEIGCDHPGGDEFLTGRVNDFRVYDHCLSVAEVHEISQGLVLHYKLDDAYIESTTNLVPNPLTFSNWTSYQNGYTSLDTNKFGGKSVIITNKGSWCGIYTPITLPATGTYTLSVYCKPITRSSTSVNQTLYCSGGGFSSDQLVSASWNNPGEWQRLTMTRTFTTTSILLYLIAYGGTKGTDTISCEYALPQIEAKDHATPFTESSRNIVTIQDSSGYGHNGTIVGDLILNSETKRYSISTKWNSSSPTDNSETGICYVQTPITLTTPLQMSITWWAKPESGYGGNTTHAAVCTSNNASRPTDYNTTAFHHRDSGFDIYPSDGSGVKRLSFTYVKNEWHHYAITYDGTTARSYQDGIEKTSVTVGTNKTLATFSQLYIGYSEAGGARRKTVGSYSDFRIYATALSADDIYELYKVEAKVDKMKEIHTYSFEEKGSRELIAGALWTEGHNQHDNVPLLANKVNGEYVLTGYSSVGSPYIPISPSGHTYVYDIDISVDADNVFYIGFERYDKDKTARSNQACVYLTNIWGTKEAARVHKHYHGTVDLSTDGTNPCAFIALRILNDWSSPNNRKATIHRLSLREVSTVQTPTINNNGIFEVDELNENMKAAFHKHGIVEATQFIEM